MERYDYFAAVKEDVINYDWLQSVGDGYGIPLTVEQGVQALNWLKKFIRTDIGN